MHDALFKALASSPEVAADILRPLLDPAVAAAIDWSTLELMPGEFVDETLRTTRADLVFRVRIHGREGFVFALLEHQSTADALMPFRVLVYIVGIWRAWLKDQSDAGITVSRLPPVIPVVVHNGLHPWSAPVDLAGVIDLPPELAALRPYLPDLTLLLDDLAATDDDRIEAQHHVPLTIATLLALKYGHGDIEPVLDRLAHHIGLASAKPGGLEAIHHVLYYLDERTESPASTRRLLDRLPPDAKEVYMTVAQQLRREGREEGREEGRVEERAEMLVNLFRQRFGDLAPRHIERIRRADAATRDRWVAGVFTAASLDDLLA